MITEKWRSLWRSHKATVVIEKGSFCQHCGKELPNYPKTGFCHCTEVNYKRLDWGIGSYKD